jgi:hypothetical protein
MKPNELAIMLQQWAEAHAFDFGLAVEGTDVGLVSITDREAVDEKGERGGAFPLCFAVVKVRRRLFPNDDLIDARARLFERQFLKLCHDLWMTKDLPLRGRVVLVN